SQPYNRCAVNSTYTGDVDTSDWHNLWRSTGLVDQPPVPEPGVEWPFGDGSSSCVSSDEQPDDRSEGGPNGEWESEVDCGGDGAEGFSRASMTGGDGVVVADVWSTFDIYLDPERGLVSRMASMARGVTLSRPDGEAAVRIDTVKAVAESWANGRAQPAEVLADEQDPEYDPNCDLRRTAGTCFERHLLGVQIVDDEGEERYSCGPCGDEEAFIDGMDSALGDNVTVRLREPDPLYARGAANGSQAAVQKPQDVAATDAKLNHDLLGNVIPALEVIRHAPYNRVQITAGLPGPAPLRGHQLYQLAGVHTGSSYEIQCLLVVHPDGTCAPAAAKPGTVTVTLEDTDGGPLAGGLFEVYADPTGDGLLGLDDPLAGTCVTVSDGSCSIEGLQPGTYVVHQSAAPAGFAPGGEVPISIGDGESWTVEFVNIAQLANIEIALSDAGDQRPLEGGVFEAWVDDGDGVIGASDVRTASCTTDAEGSCLMAGVPLGGFVVAQSAAPRMYAPAEPVAFALAQPGQTARVSVANANAATAVPPPADDGAAGTSDDFGSAPPAQGSFDPVGSSPPQQQQQQVVIPNITVPAPNVTVTVRAPTPQPAPVVAPSAPAPTMPQQIVALPRDAWDFAAREPVQAAAYGGIWLLMASAAGAVWRRRSVAQLLATT
ncbi:MAG TPA: SpaA isopeptide-forming pilin-related protein, partial [Nitriliruptorales bacterium]